MNKRSLLVFIILTTFCAVPPPVFSADRWEIWLNEVSPIMSDAEKTVFDSLQTEEDRLRFQRSFWMFRDSDPDTPQNEYMILFYERLKFARGRLGGTRTDRGRIYMILGEPSEKFSFAGSERLVDCELWSYRKNGRSGFPPVITLLFYRHRNFGEYKLFYPGAHSALDIVSPGFSDQYGNSRLSAYQDIRGSFPELAQATLSLIPGEGDPRVSAVSTSSNQTFSRIFSLPGREANTSYLNNFRSLKGSVNVTSSFREVDGFADLSISHDRGFRFLNYSVLPDIIRTRPSSDGGQAADLEFMIRLEDRDGKTVYQQEKRIRFRLTLEERNDLNSRKASFSDFLPIVDGQFKAFITFSNRTTEEFFSIEEDLAVGPETLGLVIGYKTTSLGTDAFMPLQMDGMRVYSDPRMTFDKSDTLVGFVTPPDEVDVHLIRADAVSEVVAVVDVRKEARFLSFRQPLADLSSGYYRLSLSRAGEEIQHRLISIQPYLMQKPKPFEWSETAASGPGFFYDMAVQNFNLGRLEKALRLFESIPAEQIQPEWIPVMARASFLKKDYRRVLELLEPESVARDFSVLLMLGNASLETRDLRGALRHFEALRKYGDTARLNRMLGAIHLSLGEGETARVYFERADRLGKQPPESPGAGQAV